MTTTTTTTLYAARGKKQTNSVHIYNVELFPRDNGVSTSKDSNPSTDTYPSTSDMIRLTDGVLEKLGLDLVPGETAKITIERTVPLEIGWYLGVFKEDAAEEQQSTAYHWNGTNFTCNRLSSQWYTRTKDDIHIICKLETTPELKALEGTN